MSITKKEKRLVNKKAAVTIIRNKAGLDNIKGYLLDVSNEWILVQNICECHTDGYSLFRRADVDKIYYDNKDKYFEKMLVKEKVKPISPKKYKIDITDLISILESLMILGVNVIIECEETKYEIFVIGKIVGVNKNCVILAHFDACGKWVKQNKKIPLNYITIIRFDEEYIRVFSKYLE